jgi:putative NADH-flavin reductase
MRLFVLGATGRTGLSLTRQAIERGHSVTALVRSPNKIDLRHDRLRVVTGNALDWEQVAAALPGHDAVVSILGATARAPTTICADGARSTIAAMQKTALRRLIVVSSALLFPDMGTLARIVGHFFRFVLADTRDMESQVQASNLDWTIVRPPRLTNGKATGSYRVVSGPPPAGSITRTDLARCLLDSVQGSAHVKKVIGVSK